MMPVGGEFNFNFNFNFIGITLGEKLGNPFFEEEWMLINRKI